MGSELTLPRERRPEDYTPQLFDVCTSAGRQALGDLLANTTVDYVVDTLPECVTDLFGIEYPYVMPGSPEYALLIEQYRSEYFSTGDERTGVWIYFPWKSMLVRLPTEEDFTTLRTARNKFLIEAAEQEAFYAAAIGVAGLSVGSSAVNTLTLSGGCRDLRIADFDTFALTNLNRLHGSVCDLGTEKAIIAARRAYETNPYHQLMVLREGLSLENLDRFFLAPRKLDLFIEEVDSIQLKVLSRFRARELGIPVIMATDNGDNVFIDVERFDQDRNYPLFHGLVNEEELQRVGPALTLSDRVRLASKIVGTNLTPRTQRSLMMVGTKLPSWPQLGTAATLSGVVAAYVARRIVTGEEVPSGRYHISLDEKLDPSYGSAESVAARERQTAEFRHGLDLLYHD